MFNLALLALVILMGYSANNAQRWLVLAGIRFQPSELAKILLILFFNHSDVFYTVSAFYLPS